MRTLTDVELDLVSGGGKKCAPPPKKCYTPCKPSISVGNVAVQVLVGNTINETGPGSVNIINDASS